MPQNIPLLGRAEDSLTLFRRNSLEQVANSFQLQQQDQFGGQVYKRSNATLDDLSTAIGYNAIASGNRSLAIGAFAYARENSAVALGVYAQAWGVNAIAIGDQARASGYRALAIGATVESSGANSLAIGFGAIATGNNSTAVGNMNRVSGDDATSVGQGSLVSGARGVSVGRGNTSAFTDVVMVGNAITSTANGQVILGSGTTTFSDIWLGRGVTHTGVATQTKIHATDAVGTDVPGDLLELYPGMGTGAGEGGYVNIYRARSGGVSGSTLHGPLLQAQLRSNGDVYYTGTGVLPVLSSAFDNVGLIRIGPCAQNAANAGILLCPNSDGNGNLAEMAIVGTSYIAIASLKQGATSSVLPIVFFSAGATENTNGQMAIANGVWVGDESAQSYQGQGTVNVATGIYLNGSAYDNPDFVFEQAFTGRIDRYKNRKGAEAYKRCRTLDEVKAYAQEHLHLPQLVDIGLRNSEKGDDIFTRADGALLLIEELFLHLFDLDARIKALENT